LLDPSVVDQTVRALLDSDPPADFAANRLPEDRTFPIGLDTEVCRQSVLETVAQEADQPYHREHVMPYIYEVPGRFRVVPVRAERDWGHLRWTVDTPEDLAFARAVYAHFAPRVDFGWLEVLALIEAQPELQKINADVRHKSYRESG
jgi:spore coat polysaccharide biosynthesis protein SpsF